MDRGQPSSVLFRGLRSRKSQRQSNRKTRAPGLGQQVDAAAMALDNDVVADVEAETRAMTGRFRREKSIENLPLNIRRNPGPIVFDLNRQGLSLSPCPNGNSSLASQGIRRIIEDVRPDLVQLATIRLDVAAGQEDPVLSGYATGSCALATDVLITSLPWGLTPR